jgi:GTPase SAR1 family protein
MPKCYKIVFLGSKKVGKSAIIEQLVHGHHKIGSVSYYSVFFGKFACKHHQKLIDCYRATDDY